MTLLIVSVVGVTSLSAYVVACKWLGLATADLGAALWSMLDCVGTIVLFTVINLVVGAAIILGLRLLAGRFISLYLLDDVTWLVLSGLQGITWSLWRHRVGSRSL